MDPSLRLCWGEREVSMQLLHNMIVVIPFRGLGFCNSRSFRYHNLCFRHSWSEADRESVEGRSFKFLASVMHSNMIVAPYHLYY